MHYTIPPKRTHYRDTRDPHLFAIGVFLLALAALLAYMLVTVR